MSYSDLTNLVILSPNCTKPRKHVIDTITIHSMMGICSAEECGKIFSESRRQASSNYGIGNDGTIACYVDESNRAWTTGDMWNPIGAENDHRAITIEVSNSVSVGDFTVSIAAFSSLIALVTDICYRNNIWELKWQDNKNFIGQVDKQNMTVHRWFSDTICPGPYLMRNMKLIAESVNKNLRGIAGFKDKVAAGIIGGSISASGSSKETALNPGTPSNTVYIRGSKGKGAVTTSAILSTLVDYKNRLACRAYSARSGQQPTKITVHIAYDSGSITKLAKILNTVDKAYNYGISTDGKIGLFVDENMMTYSTGDETNDNAAVNIICMTQDKSTTYPLSSETWNSLILLCTDICKRNDIKKLEYKDNNPAESTLTAHKQFTSAVNCPGPWLLSRYVELANTVNKRLSS